MNKNDVYKLIGYHGEYNASVKKTIRQLLKENHPDNKGDSKKFELINEVKKELESGKVSYDEKLSRDNKDIDYEYCYKMIDGLRINKNNLTELINAKKNALRKHESEYRDLYKKSLDLENNLLINIPHVKKVQNIKLLSIIILTLMIIVFTISVIKNNNILFITFIVLSIICVFVVQKYLIMVHKMTENNKMRFASYVKINNEIKKNIKKQNNIKKELRELKRKSINVENDLRFYKNLLK